MVEKEQGMTHSTNRVALIDQPLPVDDPCNPFNYTGSRVINGLTGYKCVNESQAGWRVIWDFQILG